MSVRSLKGLLSIASLEQKLLEGGCAPFCSSCKSLASKGEVKLGVGTQGKCQVSFLGYLVLKEI